MNKKKALTIGLVYAALLIIAIIVVVLINRHNHHESLGEVSFSFSEIEGASVSLYETDESDPSNVDKTGPVAIESVKPDVKYELEPETYIIKVTGSNIKEFSSLVFPRSGIHTSRTVPVQLNEPKLDEVKFVSEQSIIQSVYQYNSEIEPNYNIHNVSVLNDGTWAVVELEYKGPVKLSRDYLFVILKNNVSNDQWNVATKPSLIVSKLDYPDIPDDVILMTQPENVLFECLQCI